MNVTPAGFGVLLLCLPLAAGAGWAGRRMGVPYPVLLVCAGLLLGLSGWVPAPDLSPSVVFFVFLPPLIYYAAYFISPADLRANAWPIGLLAVGLVLVTMAAVAGTLAVVVPGIPLAVAAVAGAVVAPTDPVAATSVFRRLNVPERLVTVVEGEGLINDGTALVLYVTAVTAAVAGMVNPSTAAWALLAAPLGGAALGVGIAWVFVALRRRIDEPLVEITLSLATPYLTYVLAEAIGLSGILATVAAGVYMGSRSGSIYGAAARLQAFAFLDVLVFLLNAVLFTLVGMQLARVVHRVPGVSTARLIAAVAAVTAVVVGVRLAWMLAGPAIARLRRRHTASASRERVVVGWAGMRGGVSLAAALAIPLQVTDGAPFPFRDLVIVVASAVIVATLVIQGTTLPLLLRVLRVTHEDHRDEERQARLHAIRSALEWLDAYSATTAVESLRSLYTVRAQRLQEPGGGTIAGELNAADGSIDSYRALRLRLLDVERSAFRTSRPIASTSRVSSGRSSSSRKTTPCHRAPGSRRSCMSTGSWRWTCRAGWALPVPGGEQRDQGRPPRPRGSGWPSL